MRDFLLGTGDSCLAALFIEEGRRWRCQSVPNLPRVLVVPVRDGWRSMFLPDDVLLSEPIQVAEFKLVRITEQRGGVVEGDYILCSRPRKGYAWEAVGDELRAVPARGD